MSLAQRQNATPTGALPGQQALIQRSSTPIHIADVKADYQWVTLRVKGIQLWENTSDKIIQSYRVRDWRDQIYHVGLVRPQTHEEGKCYEIKSAVTNLYNDRFQIKLNKAAHRPAD